MKLQIPDNPAAAPSLPCIQCIPWFFPSSSASICAHLRFHHFISFPEFQMPFLGEGLA
jgi:hypothetical protein